MTIKFRPKNIIRHRKGASLPLVIIVFIVLTAIAGIVFAFLSANIRQAVAQERHIQAFYIMNAGLEIGSAALLMEVFVGVDPVTNDNIYRSLMEDFHDNRTMPVAMPTLTHRFDMTYGWADITVGVQNKPGSPAIPGGEWVWVRVTSTGVYVDAAGTEWTTRGSIWYRSDNPAIQVFDRGN